MTQAKEKNEAPGKTNLDSKFLRTLLVVFAAVLTFMGPTYMVYVLNGILGIDYALSIASGFALFIIGLVLIWYLVKRKILT